MKSIWIVCGSLPATSAMPCRQLQEFGKHDVQAFLADANTVNSAKYLLIVAAEAALDICNHLAAKRGGRARKTMPIVWRSWARSACWRRI